MAEDCEAEQLREEIARLAQQVLDLSKELSVYKPTLLSLAFLFLSIALWLAVLLTTGKRRDKIRRLMRRERFADETADVESTQAGSQDSVFSHGENEREEADKRVSPPSLVFEPPPEEGGQQHQQQEGVRLPKTSLPARMSDLYQSYPEDTEEMVMEVPDIVFTRASSLASGGRTPRRGSLNP